jgi:hypothetical protein
VKQIITHGGRELTLDGYTYRVADRFPEEAQGDSEWWEYRIDFSDARTGAAVMEWDSLHETYNGVVAQRLDEEGAAQALADFTENEEELSEILENPARHIK